jgi:peptide/nickel transport system permease protein
MYKWYALKRILRGVVMYVILMFVFSALFNTVSETTQRSQIEEQVRLEANRLKNLKSDQIEAFRKQRKEQLIKQYRFDRPVGERILLRAVNSVTFNFGKSTIMKAANGSQQVLAIIGEALPRTILLFTTAILIETVIGIVLGLIQARKPGGILDRSTSLITMIVYGMPAWWLGMMLIMVFVYGVKAFPSGGIMSAPPPDGFMRVFDVLWHMTLPVCTLILLGFWGLAFLIRNIVLGILQEDFIMSARARGVPENKILFGHTMRTAAPPLVTIGFLSLLASISGAILFEGIFSWPGLGNLYWIAVQQNDVPVLLGNLAITTGVYLSGLVILDLVYGFLDPRIKVGGKA